VAAWVVECIGIDSGIFLLSWSIKAKFINPSSARKLYISNQQIGFLPKDKAVAD